MHARHESPVTGRFLSVDSVQGKPKAPQGWNRYSYALDNPIRYVDPTGDEPIAPSVLSFLNSFFGEDFSSVDVHTGFAAKMATTINHPEAATVGEDIFIRPDLVGDYEAETPKGIALLAHELTHVLQYRSHGTVLSIAVLFSQYFNNREAGMNDFNGYNATDAENSALVMERIVKSFLLENKNIYAKILSGEPVTLIESSMISSALDYASYSGELRHGYQFIQGYLVYVK